jgi:hypothetical protein
LAHGFVDTCLHEKRKAKAVKKGSGNRSTRLAGNVARLADLHLVIYDLGQVGGALPRPYKYPPLVKIRTHTHHTLEIPLAKLSFLV